MNLLRPANLAAPAPVCVFPLCLLTASPFIQTLLSDMRHLSWVNGKFMQNKKELGLGLPDSCRAPEGDISSSHHPHPSLRRKRSHINHL